MTRQPALIPTLEQGREDFAGMIGRLLVSFDKSVTEAREYLELKGEQDRSYFSHRVRFAAKVELKRDGIEAEDCELEDTANSGICLVLPKYRVRVLKAAENGEIPDPGASDRRKRFLNQQSEQLELFSESSPCPSGEKEPSNREPTHIIFLWEADSQNCFTGLWFVCPNGSSKPHFKLWIPANGIADLGTISPPSNPPLDNLGFARTDEQMPGTKTGTE